MSGPDHNFAMTFNEFSRMESRIRDITLGLGDGVRLRLLKDEYIHRKSVELKVFSKVNIEKGALIDDSMLFFKRFSGGGIIKSDSVLLLGARVINSIRSGELIELKNIQILG
jgi:sialic acid synthase SpsE